MKTLFFSLIFALTVALPLSITSPAIPAEIGSPFELQGVDGKPFGTKNLNGKPYALFFGFTNCPEVCPTALYEISLNLEALGSNADLFTPVFVTVDPERDTGARLKEYLGFFDARIVGLRGSEEEIAQVARNFRVTYRKVPLSDGDYTVDHTAVIFLLDSKGAFFDKIDYREPTEAQLAKYRRLIDAHKAAGG